MSTLFRLHAPFVALAVVSVTTFGQVRTVTPPAPTGAPAAPGNMGPVTSGSGAISGVVVDGTTGAPIPGAMVSIGFSGRAISLPQRGQVTDGKGRFAFVNLPPNPNFTLSATKMGYVDGGYGRDRAPTDPLRDIPLKDGEWTANVRVTLWRPSAISGTVRDEHGDPVVGVYVRALVRARVQGREDLVAGPMTTTDDRGMYRLAALTPARYFIEVPSVQAAVPDSLPFNPAPSGRVIDGALDIDGTTNRLFIGRYPLPPPPENGRTLVYPSAFHPATSLVAQAVAIDLKFGDDRTGIDVMLDPVPAARVSGLVEGPAEALKNLTVRLVPAGLENLGPGSEAATALVGEDGRFMFLNVPAGSYVIDAPRTVNEYRWGNGGFGRGGVSMPAPPSRLGGWSTSGYSTETPNIIFTVTDYRIGAPNYSGRSAVTVGGSDVANLVVFLRKNVVLSGWFKFEADPAKPTPAAFPQFSALADPASGNTSLGMPRSQPDPDAFPEEFAIGGLGQGEYWLRVPGPGSWLIKSIQWKGREYVDTPFDAATGTDISGVAVTMTNAVPTLSGTVRQPDGMAPVPAMMLAFPADHALWANAGLTPPRFKAVPVPSSGAFRVSTLPAGDYLIVAIPTSQVGAWRDPEFLARAEGLATRVSLSWGAETTRDLTLRQVK